MRRQRGETAAATQMALRLPSQVPKAPTMRAPTGRVPQTMKRMVALTRPGAATRSSRSVNLPAPQSPSAQLQVRLRHTRRTGRPKHGVSTGNLPSPVTLGDHPTGPAGRPSRLGLDRHHQPLAVLGDRDHVQPLQADEQIAVPPAAGAARATARVIASPTVEASGVGCLVAPDLGGADRLSRGSPRHPPGPHPPRK